MKKILCMMGVLMLCCAGLAQAAGIDMQPFDFSRLSHIQGVEHFESGEMQTFRIILQNGVYSGGSDGFCADYMTAQGIVTQLDLDFDGDGAEERLVFYTENFAEDDYIDHVFTLAVYESKAGSYVLADAIELCGFGFDVDSYVRLVNREGKLYIADGWSGIFDGGVTEFFGRVIGYDGGKLMLERALYASTYGDSMFYTAPVDPDISGDVWGLMDEDMCRSLGMAEGRDYIVLPQDDDLRVAHPVYDLYYQMDGLEMANEILAAYGMNVYWDMQDGYIEDVGLNGGDTILDCSMPAWLYDETYMIEMEVRSDLSYTLPGGNMSFSQLARESDSGYDAYLQDDPWASATGYTTGNVNMRTGPGLDYDTIGSVPSGAVVDYLGETSVDDRGVAWHYICYNGMQGWGSSKYVSLD